MALCQAPRCPCLPRPCIVTCTQPVCHNTLLPASTRLNTRHPTPNRQVIEFLHVKPGKGAAFVRSKLKNFLTGGVVEKTFRAGEQVRARLLAAPHLVHRGAGL